MEDSGFPDLQRQALARHLHSLLPLTPTKRPSGGSAGGKKEEGHQMTAMLHTAPHRTVTRISRLCPHPRSAPVLMTRKEASEVKKKKEKKEKEKFLTGSWHFLYYHWSWATVRGVQDKYIPTFHESLVDLTSGDNWVVCQSRGDGSLGCKQLPSKGCEGGGPTLDILEEDSQTFSEGPEAKNLPNFGSVVLGCTSLDKPGKSLRFLSLLFFLSREPFHFTQSDAMKDYRPLSCPL